MKRTILIWMTTALLVGGATTATAQRRPKPKYRLKIATIAPQGSTWMRQFDEMTADVLEATGGTVLLKAYPGGVLGGEKDVLFKMKVGQVDGAGFLGFGIGKVCPNARALMLPMLFDSYEQVDFVFQRIRPYLEKEAHSGGYVALGWTELGFSYLFSGVPVRNMDDLRGAKPWTIANDQMMGELFRIGKVSAIPIPVGDVLTALQTGLIRTVFSPPLAAVATQWFTRVKYRSDTRLTYSFGGVFIAERSWKKMPAETQETVSRICHRHMDELTAKVRKSNREALDVMAKRGIELIKTDPEGVQALKDISAKIAAKIQGDTYSTEAGELVKKYLEEYAASGKEE
ncbi:MAG: TRAP transporter substrate-binding protein DctP [Lentisphaerae bacterium]|nr:TRAP transporter substrate-binding protein DctP [Lentisphaerota bacterium]